MRQLLRIDNSYTAYIITLVSILFLLMENEQHYIYPCRDVRNKKTIEEIWDQNSFR